MSAAASNSSASNIIITTADMSRLKKLLWPRDGGDRHIAWNISALREEIGRAKVVQPKNVPPDVVTMNSTVQVSSGNGSSMTVSIVYPEHADIDQGRISILSPMAMALLGYRVGEEVSWSTPAGPRRYTIEKLIYQPESARQWICDGSV